MYPDSYTAGWAVQAPSSRQPLHSVVFDMDGLLFDSERIVKQSWDTAGDILGYPRLGEHIYHTLGQNRASRRAYFLSVYGPGFPYERFQDLSREAFRRQVRLHGLPVKTGAKELLDFLREEGIPCALATSSSRDYCLGNLRAAHIEHCFRQILTGDMVTHSKPHPEIYASACRLLGASPARSIALEDSPNGIRSAHAAGLNPVLIPDLMPISRIVKEAPDIRPLLAASLPTLAHVIPYIQEHFLMPARGQ